MAKKINLQLVYKSVLLSAFFIVHFTQAKGQYNISGYVLDQDNGPIPSASVFVRELSTGTASDANGRYLLTLQPGSYEIVFSSIGYETSTLYVVLKEQDQTHNVQLKTSIAQLDELVVSAKRRDPAYDIVQKVIANRDKFLTQINSQKTTIYLKAREEITIEEREKKKFFEIGADGQDETTVPDALEELNEEAKPKLNMLEMELVLDYQAPNKYMEERTAYSTYGTTSGLFVPRFKDLDFNFYDNLVYLKALTEVPVISPIATTSILTYKYKLVETYREPQGIVYKIKVTPRKAGNSSCSGYIYVNDEFWNLRKVDLNLEKGTLKFYDEFNLVQEYQLFNDSLWLVNRQEFNYTTKEKRTTTFGGQTTLTYKDRKINFDYPEKYFGPQVSITKQDAYERDSGYWSSIRPEPLNKEEEQLVKTTDSIRAIVNSQAYKDSMEALYNKITWSEFIYDGLGFRKGEDRYLFMSSLTSLINYQVVAGWRIGPYVFYFKRWANGRFISTQNNFSIGLKNGDWNGNAGFLYRYNPLKFADIRVFGGRSFSSINTFDAFLNQLSASNYILTEHLDAYHRIELVNGLFLKSSLSFDNRSSLDGFNNNTALNEFIGDRAPISFEGYQALISSITLSYSPKQQYMLEPNRKIILRNPWPTFSINHKKGWQGPFGSDVNFDYLEFSIYQSFNIGIFGKSTYTFSSGKFINTKELKFIDYTRFRQSDPIFFSNPLYSFQMLDTALAISTMYYEAHYLHSFNGALINNIPLLKKSRIMAVAGAGALWINEPNYRYVEALVGVERIFKLGARRRLKLGVYGVIGESNLARTRPGLKFSLDIIDTWKSNWNY